MVTTNTITRIDRTLVIPISYFSIFELSCEKPDGGGEVRSPVEMILAV